MTDAGLAAGSAVGRPATDGYVGATRSLKLATLTTATLVAMSLGLRVLNPFGVPEPDVSDWVPHLWAMGALLVVALTFSWAPTLAWSALIVATTAAALGVEGIAREYRALTSGEPPPDLAVLLTVALAIPAIVAAAYASLGERRARSVSIAAWTAAAAITGLLIAALVRRALEGERGGIPAWAWLAVIGILWGLGLARDLRPALGRTRARLQAGDANRSRPRAAFGALRVFLDELVPGREAGRAEAAETERGRIAADLHAEVLPSLRRALAEAEGGGTVERLAADLRTAVDEVEALLLARRSIVLEEMGLLSGIEWLAERTEDRSDVRVQILVDGEPVAAGARPPRDVERAAFRVTQLALDNVVRHAPGSSVAVTVGVAATRVHVHLEDDAEGPPIDEEAAARRGRRGLADMRAEARSCGATLVLGRGAGGRGTAVDFRWDA